MASQPPPRLRDALTATARALEAQGWEIGEPALPPLREAMELQLTLWLAEFALGGGDAVAREADPDASFVHHQLTKARATGHAGKLHAGASVPRPPRPALARVFR